MRILHIWDHYSPPLFDQSHPYCMEHGVASRLLAGSFIENGAEPLAETDIFSRTTTSELNSTNLLVRLYRRIRRLDFWRRFGHFCSRHVEKFKPDLLHIHFGTTAASLFPLLEKTSIPIVVSLYGVDASAVLRDQSWAKRYLKLFERASMFLVLCDAVVVRLVALGCPKRKIHVLNLPAGVENYPRRRREFDGTTRFLIAARFVEKKGHATLLRAFREVLSQRKDVHLTMMGYGPSNWVRELVRELCLEDSTTLINNGLSSDFVRLYNQALAAHDVLVAPSTMAKDGDDEAGPALTMVAAQAAGLPVIATPFLGSELSLIPGETGLLCKQDDVTSLASCMLELCARPDIWKKLGEIGSSLAHREFSRVGQMEKLIHLYEEAVSEHLVVR